MTAVDTSVVVAAFAPWHESHVEAREAIGRRTALPAHCALEAYSVLTRLPDPFRAPPDVAAEFIRRRFGSRWLDPGERARDLPERLAELGIVGGACYDALVAETARENGAVLLTLDRRAGRTYHLMGVEYEVVIRRL